MKKSILTLFGCLGLAAAVTAQEVELTPVEKLEQRIETLENANNSAQKFKVSGYIQAQYQHAETAADGNNFKLAKAANSYESNAYIPGTSEYKGLDGYDRFGIRRGRIKFSYTEGIAEGVIQLDVTDKGINDDARNVVMFKDVYLSIKDPIWGTNSFKAGIFDRPFGHEIAYSSSRRESPERARIIQSLFPDERDLGAMLTLQADKNSPWNILKLEAGVFAGSGIKPQFDNHFDFIGHLSAKKTIGDMEISGGFSAYLGGVMQCDSNLYVMKDNMFVLDNNNRSNIGGYAKRQYFGIDAQYSIITPAGLTQLRGEYIWGEHPGNASGAYNFKFTGIQTFASNPGVTPAVNSSPVYMRKISGGYVILTQDLGTLPLTAVVKYDWYNPNTEVSGDDIYMPTKNEAGDFINGFNAEKLAKGEQKQTSNSDSNGGELIKSNIGLGLIWKINSALKLTAYYDIVSNEKTKNIKDSKIAEGQPSAGKITKYGYEDDRPDNVFTLRLQYKF